MSFNQNNYDRHQIEMETADEQQKKIDAIDERIAELEEEIEQLKKERNGKIKIKTNQYVWVDKNEKIKEGDYYYVDNSLGKRIENILPYPSGFVAKIIAASPELNLDVPTYIEYLAEQYAISKSSADVFKQAHKTDFINGFQTAEKELFTEEELRTALSESFKASQESYQITSDEIIKQLKQERCKI